MDLPPQRSSTLLTPVSVALALFVLIVLGFILWLNGGTVFNPGPVSAKSLPGMVLQNFQSHADFESRCDLCHQPIISEQAPLCLDCHQDIDLQISQTAGLHGRLEKPQACSACHQEHRGRLFDPSQAALVSFDHSHTRFPLTGQHGTLNCQRCHTDGNFSAAGPACASCHAEPAVHAGLFSTDCAACHTTFAWSSATMTGKPFNHSSLKFSLAVHTRDYAGSPIPCTGCHAGASLTFNPAPCQNCHGAQDATFLQKHTQQFGSDCLTCHDGVDRLHQFDHQVTFPMTGKHAGLQCTDCHQNNQFRGTSPRCAACHLEPAIHAGFFGSRCDYCHTNQAWTPAPLHAHTFPLEHGGQGEIVCKTCHPATYAAYRCDTCHEQAADSISRSHARLTLKPEQLADCTACHLTGKR